MDKERFFISLFNNKLIGDDGACIDGYVYSSDAFFEDVHFKREWMDPQDIGYKAMIVNISDALAMNAEPLYALVDISLPKEMKPAQMERIAKGLQRAAKEHGCQIVGGDTIAASKINIALTIISKTKRPIGRKGVKEGYLLAFTGDIGSVGRDLRRLLRGARVSKRSKFFRPSLRKAFLKRASRFVGAMMDISDGLFSDLQKLCEANKMGCRFIRDISKYEGCSGEEYELLIAFDPRKKEAIMRRAKMSRTKITIFAQAQRGRFRSPCRPHHF